MNNFNVGDRVYLPGENLHGVVGNIDRKVSLSILLDDGRTISRWDYYAIPEPSDIKDMLIDALCTDGAQHKQYYLYQIAKKFGLDVGSITSDSGIVP